MHSTVLIEIGCERPERNEPIGISTIAAYLEHTRPRAHGKVVLRWERLAGHEVRDEDLARAKLIGISAQINTLSALTGLVGRARCLAPSATVVVGNLLSIYAYQQLLREFPDILFCTGEGEMAFAEIERAITQAGRLDRERLVEVPNLAYLEHASIRRTRPHLMDLSVLPPPRRDFAPELARANGIIRVEASRGCHWGRCEFCSVASRFGEGGYRTFDIDRVLNDLAELGRLGVRAPYFSDEDFFGRQYTRSIELANRITAAKKSGAIPASMNFFASVLASDVKHHEGQAALSAWKAAGLREVFVGVEAGAEEEIRRFAKKANSQTNGTAIEILLAMGFQVDIGFIMFDPEMTLADLKQNIAWLKSHLTPDIDSRVTKSLRIQPLTGLATKYGHLISGPLNIDELTFPSRYADPRVADVRAAFSDWEAETKTMVYALLATARGEVESESRRAKTKQLLARLRDIDLEFLTALVNAVEDDATGFSHSRLRAVAAAATGRKRALLAEAPSRLIEA